MPETETCPLCKSTNVTSKIDDGTPFYHHEPGVSFKAMVHTCHSCDLRYVDMIRCPECESEAMTVTKEETFQYGADPKTFVMLTVEIPVHSCHQCKMEFTDYVAEELRERAVREYLARKQVN